MHEIVPLNTNVTKSTIMRKIMSTYATAHICNSCEAWFWKDTDLARKHKFQLDLSHTAVTFESDLDKKLRYESMKLKEGCHQATVKRSHLKDLAFSKIESNRNNKEIKWTSDNWLESPGQHNCPRHLCLAIQGPGSGHTASVDYQCAVPYPAALSQTTGWSNVYFQTKI